MGAPGKFDTAESLSVVGCVGLYYSQALLFCFQFFGDIFEVMADEVIPFFKENKFEESVVGVFESKWWPE